MNDVGVAGSRALGVPAAPGLADCVFWTPVPADGGARCRRRLQNARGVDCGRSSDRVMVPSVPAFASCRLLGSAYFSIPVFVGVVLGDFCSGIVLELQTSVLQIVLMSKLAVSFRSYFLNIAIFDNGN